MDVTGPRGVLVPWPALVGAAAVVGLLHVGVAFLVGQTVEAHRQVGRIRRDAQIAQDALGRCRAEGRPAVVWYVDPWDASGCASDFNDCKTETCDGPGQGPCATADAIVARRRTIDQSVVTLRARGVEATAACAGCEDGAVYAGRCYRRGDTASVPVRQPITEGWVRAWTVCGPGVHVSVDAETGKAAIE